MNRILIPPFVICRTIALLMVVITIQKGSAQYEQIFHKPYKEKTGALNTLAANIIAIENIDSAFTILADFKKRSIEENDLEAQLESRIMEVRFKGQRADGTEEELVTELLEVVNISSDQHLFITEARTIKAVAWYYWHIRGNYELACDYLIKLDEILHKIPDDEFPDKVDCLLAIGSCYHFFGDFNKAKNYFLEAALIKETPVNAMARGSCINSLGVCYRDLDLMDSSDLTFKNFLADKTSLGYDAWEGMISGNLGYNYYLRKEFDLAIPLLLHDKSKALENNDLSLAAGACTPLADIYISLNRLEEAGDEIKNAYQYIHITKQNDRLRQLFPVMSKWYSKMGKPDLAAAYMDSTLIALSNYQEKKNSLQLLRASQRSEIEKNKIAILKIQREKEHTIFIRNLVIVTLVFTVLLLGVFFQNRSKRHKQEQHIKDLKIKENEIELKRSADQLAEFSRRIVEKNELIEKLEKESQLQDNNKLLVELKQSAILTEEDWTRFKRIYEQLYPQFFQKLKNKFPELSPAEIRYITLSKLGFSTNEVANCLGISRKSIHVTWHRIKKKLEFSEEQTINDLVAKLDG